MKRNSFLTACLTVVATGTSSLARAKDFYHNYRPGKAFWVKSGKDRNEKSISLFEGDTFSTKVSTLDSDGDIFVFESTRVKEGGPSHHVHFEQDEWWYVLSGEFLIKVGDTTYEAKAGDSVFGPRMVPHSFSKVGEGEGKLLMYFQPAGKMEEFFKKVSAGAMTNMSEAEQDQFRETHGFKRVGPPIKYFKKW